MSNPSKNITPSLGVDTSKVFTSADNFLYKSLPALGTVMRGQNGRMYILAEASGVIADNTAVILTEPAMTVAAGVGAWTTRAGAMVATDRAWVESNVI